MALLLVKVNGQWLTPGQAAAIEKKKAQAEQPKFWPDAPGQTRFDF